MRRTALALLVLASSAMLNGPPAQAREALAGVSPGRAPSRCWKAPQPQTVEEAVIAAQNKANVAARARSTGPAAMLALSDGRLKSAYGAGLLVGWSETGARPDFAVVTAVGMSALFAPFAFLGSEGDGAIADIFACDASNLQEMAERAASYLDANVVEKIALRHETGARLLVALPGSAARRETVWDLGAIAASRHPEARRQIGAILLAAVDLTTFIDPETMPASAGLAAVRNPALRRVGAGEPFLSAPSLRKPAAPTYLIHNGVLFPDEGEQYAAAQAFRADAAQTDIWLVPGYDLFTAAQRWQAPMLIASPRPYMNIQPQQSAFDLSYMRALFLDAYRQGRMRREWRSSSSTASRARDGAAAHLTPYQLIGSHATMTMDTKSALLAEAETLIRTMGYAAFSYADLSERVGIRKASIHHHFPTKESLGIALIDSYLKRFVAGLDELAAQPIDTKSKLLAYGDLFADSLRDGQMPLCGALAADAAYLPVSMQRRVKKFFELHLAWLDKIVREGIAKREIKAGTPPQRLALLLLSALQGASVVAWASKDPTVIKPVFRQVVDGLTE